MLPTTLWTRSYFNENEEQCLNLLNSNQHRQEIPLLYDQHRCKEFNEKLVKFRGMVQDILNPILYVKNYKVLNKDTKTVSIRCAKYCDSMRIEENEEVIEDPTEKAFLEKQEVHCIPIPGLNSWVPAFNHVDIQSNSPGPEKKRRLATGDVDVDMRANFTDPEVPTNVLKSSNNSNVIPGVILNIYNAEVKLLLNDVIEVIGFLSIQTDVDYSNEGINYYKLLMKIHVVNVIPSYSIFETVSDMCRDLVTSCTLQLRDELWIMLTDLLLGDTLAADYLICNLISSVYSQNHSSTLGKFTLNISNLPSELKNFNYTSSVYRFLAYLLEKSVYVPLSINYLNSAPMIPRRNIEQNRLSNGLLQLSNRTHLIIDETRMEPGQLVDMGVRNMQALSEIILNQTAQYDFEFYKLPFFTNIPVLTLSERKSLLPNDITLILEPDKSCIKNVKDAFTRTWQKMSEPFLGRLRVYLNCISSLEYNITNEMQQFLEKCMVRMRKEENNRTSVDDLHKLMVLSRLMSISRGLVSLTKDTWEYSIKMERQRKARL